MKHISLSKGTYWIETVFRAATRIRPNLCSETRHRRTPQESWYVVEPTIILYIPRVHAHISQRFLQAHHCQEEAHQSPRVYMYSRQRLLVWSRHQEIAQVQHFVVKSPKRVAWRHAPLAVPRSFNAAAVNRVRESNQARGGAEREYT